MHEPNGLGKRAAAANGGEGEPMSEETEGNIPPPEGVKVRADLFEFLDRLGIEHETVEHPPIFTVKEGRALKLQWPGGHSKNLFLKDKKGALFLAVALGETKVDLVGLGKALGAKGRLSFGKPELMTATLGVIPGAVTPFALINETAKTLSRVILDTNLLAHDPVWFHPLENTASTGISPENLVRFVEACGFTPGITDLASPAGL
jgi:Ala-tRNA(Pro) deacylase